MALLQISEPGMSPAPHERRLAVGIDLGTTNSLVATVRNGVPGTLPDQQGRVLLPSIVRYLPDGRAEVGYPAQARQAEDAKNTIVSVKRYMGRGVKDVAHVENAPYDFVDSPGMLQIRTCAGVKSPVEVSAEILKTLRARAEASLGGELAGAVITVPAYFDDAQRQATKDAGKLAGLNVLRLLNEPTAAAIAYGLENASEGIYAVYDLGGGAFDISILRLSKGVFEVVATAGDAALGGDDFDQRVFCWIVEEAKLAPLGPRIATLEAAGQTVIALARDGAALGLLAFADRLKPDAAEAVAALRRLGIAPVLVTGDQDRVALPLGNGHRHDLTVEGPPLDGGNGPLVAGQGKRVLTLAADGPTLDDVLGRLAHRVRVVHGRELRVQEPPAEGRVLELAGAAVPGALGLGHHVRRPGHRFDAAGNEHVAVVDRDRVSRRVDRLEAGATEPVHGQACHLDREPREQQRHPGDVPVVLAGLVGAAEDDVLDQGRFDPGPIDDRPDRERGQVVGPDGREGTAVPPHGGPDGIDDPGLAEGPVRVAGHEADGTRVSRRAPGPAGCGGVHAEQLAQFRPQQCSAGPVVERQANASRIHPDMSVARDGFVGPARVGRRRWRPHRA